MAEYHVSFTPSFDRELIRAALPSLHKLRSLIENDMRANCPVDTGELLASVFCDLDPNTGTITGGATAVHAEVVERGSGPHTIHAKPGKTLRWVDESGQVHFAKSVRHPGTAAQPFIRTAFYRKRSV